MDSHCRKAGLRATVLAKSPDTRLASSAYNSAFDNVASMGRSGSKSNLTLACGDAVPSGTDIESLSLLRQLPSGAVRLYSCIERRRLGIRQSHQTRFRFNETVTLPHVVMMDLSV